MCADLGGTAHFLGYREGTLEQLMQVSAQTTGGVGLAHRIFHLAQDLRFAQHHRIQPGGDAEGMAHGIVLRQRVEIRTQVGVGNLVVLGQELRGTVDGEFHTIRAGSRCGIELGTVAGGKDGRLARGHDLVMPAKPCACGRHRLTDLVSRESHFFAQRDRRGSVVESDGEQIHERID